MNIGRYNLPGKGEEAVMGTQASSCRTRVFQWEGGSWGNNISSHAFPLAEPNTDRKPEGLMWPIKANLLGTQQRGEGRE